MGLLQAQTSHRSHTALEMLEPGDIEGTDPEWFLGQCDQGESFGETA